MLRALVGLLSLLALSGCGVIERLYQWTGLAPCTTCAFGRDQSFGPGADFGLLVYGVTVKAPNTGKGDFSAQVEWLAETTPTNDTIADLWSIDLPEGTQPGQHAVVVWRVRPGIWSLRQAHWRLGDDKGATIPFGGRTLATQVTAGEITYVGEMTVDGQQLVLGGDEAAARVALAAYPGIAVPPRSRPLHDIRRGKGGGTRHDGAKPADSAR